MSRETMRAIMSDAIQDAINPHIIANNTIEYTLSDGERRIRLHHTDIIIFKTNGSIVFNTGGWQTVTTKERFNRFGKGRFYSDKGIWFYSPGSFDGPQYAFQDGMTLSRNGKVTKAGPDPRKTLNLRKAVRAYAKAYIVALRAGDIPKPNNGDCWGCLKRATDGSHPMGGKDHIRDHIKEKYYVPSLLVNALGAFGGSQVL